MQCLLGSLELGELGKTSDFFKRLQSYTSNGLCSVVRNTIYLALKWYGRWGLIPLACRRDTDHLLMLEISISMSPSLLVLLWHCLAPHGMAWLWLLLLKLEPVLWAPAAARAEQEPCKAKHKKKSNFSHVVLVLWVCWGKIPFPFHLLWVTCEIKQIG